MISRALIRRRRRLPLGGGVTYDADAVLAFAAMSVEPSDPLKLLVSNLITTMKSDGTWALVDWLGLGPMHDAQAARVNIKTPAQVATAVNSPVFTAKQGYAGDNTAAYLDSGVAGSTITDTDQSLFVRVRTNISTAKRVMGYSMARHSIVHSTNAAAFPAGFAQSATASTATTAGADGQFICVSRTGTTQTIQVGTAVEDTDTVVTSAGATVDMIRFLAAGTNYSGAQLSAWGFGKHLDNTKATALRAALNTFITAAEAL